MLTLITISAPPDGIDFTEIEIKQGECIKNSFIIAKMYPAVEIVEGFIVIIDNEKSAKALPHVWNKLRDVHFDVTKESIWEGREESDDITNIKYLCTRVHQLQDFKNGDVFEFCSDTKVNVEEVNEYLNNKQ